MIVQYPSFKIRDNSVPFCEELKKKIIRKKKSGLYLYKSYEAN
jgi:hypothetical protein